MHDREQSLINPANATTRVIEHSTPSRVGLPARMMVSVATTPEGEYIQLGSVKQVRQFLDVTDEIARICNESCELPSIRNLFRQLQRELCDDLLEEEFLKPRTFAEVQQSIHEGDKLIKSGYVATSRPDLPSIPVPDKKGVWAPSHLALGNQWILKSSQPTNPTSHTQ